MTATVNHAAGQLLLGIAPRWAWLATAAVPSCLTIVALCALLGDRTAFGWPAASPADRRKAWRLAGAWLTLWLAGSTVAAWAAGGWITYAVGWPALLAFLLFGPLGEELLFRGLIYPWARRVVPATPWFAVTISTAAFCLHHIQLHRDPLHGLALAQLFFTIPMGLVLGLLRARTDSVWPGLLLHIATNLPAAF